MNLREALQLHQLLHNYLYDVGEGELDVLEYSRTIIKNILADEKPDVFIKALGRMAKINFSDIIKMDSYARTSLFVECVFTNRLWLLNGYLRRIGYGTS